MDITLERILSLLPHKPDGKYVHGSKKAFADSLSLPHNIVMEWESGKSRSYRNYLYEISEKHNVSVEWLKGETDIKEKAAPISEDSLDAVDIEILKLFNEAPEWKKKAALALLRAAEDGE